MSDFAIAGLCLLCWLNGVVFGWAFWELPRLDFAIAGLCLLYWLNGVVFGWAFWELPRLKKRKHDPVAWTDIDFKDIYISEIVAKEKNAVVSLYTTPPQRKPLPPQSPCEMTQAEGKMFKLGWLECEAAHGIKE